MLDMPGCRGFHYRGNRQDSLLELPENEDF